MVMEEGGGRWGPPYQGMYDSDFWKRPAFQHWRAMLERGRQFAAPGSMSPAAGEVLATNVLPAWCSGCWWKMWRPRRPSRTPTKKSWRSTRGIRGG